MGSSSWSNDAYSNLRSTYSTKSTNQIFTQNVKKTIAADMSPKGLVVREARDSVAHPESLAILIALDETGSMGKIPEIIVKDKLGTIMETLIKHGVEDAAILFCAIGDTHSDKHPLQVGQFESGTDELNKWLTSAYLEGNGGGQNKEDYLLAWLIAARHTSIDCFEKRQQKGILFTIGDEASWNNVNADTLKEIMGYAQAEELTDEQLLREAQRMYHVFHIHVNEGNYKNDPTVLGYWKKLLGERVIICEDHNQIAELIATTVAVIHGADIDSVTSSFSKGVANDVKNALVKVDTSVTRKRDSVISL